MRSLVATLLIISAVTCSAQVRTQRTDNAEFFFNASAGHITIGGGKGGNGFYAGGVTITNWTDLIPTLGLYTNGGFTINVIGGQTNTVFNGGSITISGVGGGGGGSGGGNTNWAAYGTPVQLQSITSAMSTTNLVDGTSNPFDVVLYFDKACTVVVEADLNYIAHTSGSAAGGLIAIAAGANSVTPNKLDNVTDYQGTISTSGTLDNRNSPLTLRSFYSFASAGTCEFHVTGQINSPGTLSFNGEGVIYAEQLGAGGGGGGGSGTNYYSAGNGLQLSGPVFSIDPAVDVTNGGFVINVVGGATQKVVNAGSITITPSGINSLGYTNAALSNSSVVGLTAYLGTNIPPIGASNTPANGSVNTNGWQFGTAASGVTSLGYTNAVLSNSSVVAGVAYLGTNIPPILPSFTTVNGGFVNTNGWSFDRLNGFIISNSPALPAGQVVSNRNVITIGTKVSAISNSMVTAGYGIVLTDIDGGGTNFSIAVNTNVVPVITFPTATSAQATIGGTNFGWTVTHSP